jgi:hypothetical protein
MVAKLIVIVVALVATPHDSRSEDTALTFSADGSTLAFEHQDPLGRSSIVLARPDGSRRRVVPGEGHNPSLNGRLIALDAGGFVWKERRDGSDRVRVTAGQDPEWAPDGHGLAFVRNGDIYVLRGTRAHRLTRDGGNAGPSWSPDGKQIVFWHASTAATIEVVAASGGGRRSLGRGMEPAWSPDGTRIAFTCPAGVCVMRPDGSGRRLDIKGAFRPAWQPVTGSRRDRREIRRAVRSRRSGRRAPARP